MWKKGSKGSQRAYARMDLLYKMKTNQLTKFLERDLLSKALRNALAREV